MNIRKFVRHRPFARVLAGSVAALLAGHGAQAVTTVYLDTNGTTAGSGITSGASITWDSSPIWNTALDGTGSVQAWAAGNIADFAAGTDATGLPYTVTIGGSGQSAAGLTVEEGHVSLTGSPLTLTSTAAINVSSGADITISSVIAGTAGLSKSGVGTATLSADNTYSGTTTVNAGNGQLNINNGGTGVTNSAIGISSLVLIGGTIDNTSNGPVILATNNAVTFSTFTFGGSNNLNFGTGAATVNTNTASVTLNGTNSTLTFGGVLTNNQNSSNESFAINGAGNTLAIGGFTSSGHTGGKNLLLIGTGNLTVNGAITNGTDTSVAVSWGSTGTLTLNGVNTYTGATTVGTTAGAGNVILTAGSSLANTAITVTANATSSPAFSVPTGAGGVVNIGNNGTVAAGASLAINPGTAALPQAAAFSMADNAVGTLNLVQESTFAGNALTLGAATGTGYVRPTLAFDIGGTSLTDIDRINVTKLASVGSGGAVINFTPVTTATALVTGDYTFISASGGFSGTGGNGLSLGVTTFNLGGHLYALSLANSTTTAEILTVSAGSATPASAYWTGAQGDGNWSSQAASPAFTTNFAVTAAGTMDTFALPGSTTNVFFTANSATNLSTTLNQSFTINSLTFTGTGTSNMAGTTISSGTGTNLLTINGAAVNGNVAANGITVAAGSGPNIINANVRFANGAQTWTINTGALLTINGSISDGGSGMNLTKAGAGTLILTGANTYTGFTLISGGTLQGSDSNVYTGATNTLVKVFGTGLVQPDANSTLQLRANGTNDSTSQTLTFGNQLQGAGGSPYTVDVDRQASTGGTNKTIALGLSNVGVNVKMNVTGADGFQLAIGQLELGGGAAASTVIVNPTTANLIIASVGLGSNTLSPTLDLDGTATGNRITGVIANNIVGGTTSLLKTNSSTWTLAGTSTYTGTTTVSGGTLLVSGSISASTATVSNAGSTFGGTGTIGAATINSDAILQGGDGVNATGALSSAGNISLTSGSEIKLTLGVGGAHSTLARTGGLWSFDSAQAFVLNSGAAPGTYQDIITGLTGSEAGLSTIANWTVLNPEYAGSTFTFDGANVDLILVPEPAPAAALVASFASLLGLQRFRRRKG